MAAAVVLAGDGQSPVRTTEKGPRSDPWNSGRGISYSVSAMTTAVAWESCPLVKSKYTRARPSAYSSSWDSPTTTTLIV